MATNNRRHASSHEPTIRERAKLNPGDEARPGTPGTAEDICPQCHGSGRSKGGECRNCGGTGRITKAVGGA
jgi:hypothetical protein